MSYPILGFGLARPASTQLQPQPDRRPGWLRPEGVRRKLEEMAKERH